MPLIAQKLKEALKIRCRTDVACLVLSVVAWMAVLIVGLFTLNDYGISVDEPFRWQGGYDKLDYYENLLNGEFEANHKPGALGNWYPGFFDLTFAVLQRYGGLYTVHASHLLSFAFGLATYLGVWLIGHRLGGCRLAFWSMLFMIAMPRYYGHIFMNPKDVPFAACFTWALYFLISLIERYRRMPWHLLIALGIAIGLTTAVRVGGLLAWFYSATFFGLCLVCLYFDKNTPTCERLESGKRIVRGFVLLSIVSFLTLLPWWPYIHSDTLGRLMEAASGVSQFPWIGYVKHDGVLYDQDHIPWHYMPDWITMTVPLLYQALFIAALVLLLWQWKRDHHMEALPWFIQRGLLIFSIVFPVIFIVLRQSTVYNGMRHVFFILPPLACLSAWALVRILDWLRSKRPKAALVGGILALLAVGHLLVTMARLHPYEYVYFNALVGGLPGAAERYDLEYWSTAHREAIKLLQERISAEEAQTGIKRTYKVATTPPYYSSAYFFPDNFVWQYMDEPDDPDFFIALNMLDYPQRLDGRLYDSVERMGVPLVYIYDRRHLLPVSPLP